MKTTLSQPTVVLQSKLTTTSLTTAIFSTSQLTNSPPLFDN
ncbi:hypothetical protein [Gallibacterium salpingitidis]|nr:hypothetical protein [Gallibacterium salpingitidis]